MSLLRVLALGTAITASTATVCLVAVDRLDHPAAGPVAATSLRTAVRPEPATTGTIAQQGAGEAAPPRLVGGFDTERLDALMRGETPATAGRRR